MHEAHKKQLIERYLSGKASDQELMAFFGLVEKEDLLQLIEQHMDETIASEPNRHQTKRLWPKIAIAASILLTVTVAAYFVINQNGNNKQQLANNRIQQDVKPGGKKAYLTLANGQRISLTDAKNGTIASQGSKTIQKTADGMIIYDNSHSNHNITANSFNTIETPRGGQYQVVLPDGSKVWLNAASSLKYPAEFNQKDRIVELTGEAYFEVAKDKAHPFKVRTANQEVEVLGTHFDINSYSDEPNIATTLLEGSVKVTANSTSKIIKPGEQATNHNGQLKIAKANIETITDWKDGDFNLEGLEFKEAMRKIGRWYDVEIIYQADFSEHETGGWVSRQNNLSSVLKLIERLGFAHFKIEGKKVYVNR